MLRKTFAVPDFKARETEGSFQATIATLSVRDHDGDVTLPGAFIVGEEVKIAAWGHDWGALPVGRGTIGADNERAWVNGEFFLNTVAGQETYTTVKNLGSLCEWSYGYEILERSFGEWEDQEVQFLRRLRVFESCPVMLGAGIETRTDWVKHAPDNVLLALLSDSLPLDRHAETVVNAVQGLSQRLDAHAALRVKEGRELSEANRERIREMAESAGSISKGLAELYERTAPEPKGADPAEVLRLLIGFERQVARLHGVEVA